MKFYLQKRQLILLLAGFVFFINGCAVRELTLESWKNPKLSTVWPEPPQPARIELLRVIGDASDLQDDAKKNRFLQWLIGDKDDAQPLISPYGITADGQGKVWVADPGSALIHLFDLARQDVEYIGQAGKELLLSPVDVVFDPLLSRLYISDSGLRKVFVYSASGDYINSISFAGQFQRPAGLAVDKSSNLYVVDVLSGLVEVFDPQGKHLKSVGSAASADGLFSHPSNIDVDAQGRLYIVDSLRFRVEIQSADGELLGLIGQVGDSFGSFARPRGIAVDSSGHIYVVDAAFDNIQIFDLAGRLLLHFAAPGGEPGELCLPAGLHIDDQDRIYVAEACNHRFQIFQFVGVGE